MRWIPEHFKKSAKSSGRRTLPLLGVRQDFVCSLDVFKLFCRLLVARMLVGMIQQRQLAIAFLNLLLSRVALDVENLHAGNVDGMRGVQ